MFASAADGKAQQTTYWAVFEPCTSEELLGIQGSNPGFLDQNQACFLYTNPHRQSGNSYAYPSFGSTA